MPELFCLTPKNVRFKEKNSSYSKFINFRESKLTAVQRHLLRGGLGSYEPDVQAAFYTFCELMNSRLVIYDVGAHIGIYSALISTIFKSKNPYILAYEPTPATAIINRDIRDSNNLSYSVIEKGISSQPGMAKLHISPIAESSNSLNAKFRSGEEFTTIKITTIDKIVNEGNPAPSLIKIDVETLEYAVILGGFESIKSFKPTIICEILTKSDKELTYSVLKALEVFGYKFYALNQEIDWKAFSASEVINNVTSNYPDWIFTIDDITPEFVKTFLRWRSALHDCTEKTNVILRRGELASKEVKKMW